jgi:hypothetical protein
MISFHNANHLQIRPRIWDKEREHRLVGGDGLSQTNEQILRKITKWEYGSAFKEADTNPQR